MTSRAVRGLVCPDRFADVVARGPVWRSNDNANGWFGMRTPMVGRGEMSAGRWMLRGTIRVNAPGQNRDASSNAAGGRFGVTMGNCSISPINTAIAFVQFLPLARNNWRMLASLSMPEASPYTVSVGKAIKPPSRRMVRAAGMAPGSRIEIVVVVVILIPLNGQ